MTGEYLVRRSLQSVLTTSAFTGTGGGVAIAIGVAIGSSYMSVMSHRTNELMRVLTVVASVFIPLTFLAGVYGMNFENMPELQVSWAYPGVIGLMLLIGTGRLALFARLGWISSRRRDRSELELTSSVPPHVRVGGPEPRKGALMMQSPDIRHFVYIPFSPPEVFCALMDEPAHASFTGAPAKIDAQAGGAFSVFGGTITGVTTELKPSALIVQDWRSEEWPKGQNSTARFELEATNEGRGCALTFRHTGVPPERRDQIDEGWRRYYWQPLADHLRGTKVAVVRQFLEEFKNQRKLDVVDETWTEDCVLHIQGFTPPRGRVGQKEVGRLIFNGFTHVHVDVIDTIVEGDRVVERHHATARHTGEFMGLAPTDKVVYWTENHVYRIRDGLIAETWSEVSFHDLIAQISGTNRSTA